MHCPTCQAETPSSDRFCRHCGSPLPAEREVPVAVSDTPPASPAGAPGLTFAAAPSPPPGPPPPTAVAPPASEQLAAAAQRVLLPRFPCKLLWSPRKPWSVTTKLSERELADLFTGRMTRNANLLRQFNDYFRRAHWEVQRNAISGELIATCKPTGPVSVGFGKNKFYVDISADTIICQIDRPSAGARTEATVGVGRYTTIWWLYAYPSTVYTFDFVKAVKRADRDASIKYPWSIARMILLAALLVFLIVAASSGGGSSSSSGTADAPPPAAVASASQSSPATESPANETSTSETSTSSEVTLPSRPSSEPTELAQQINSAETIIHDTSSSAAQLAAAGRLEQLATRELFKGNSAFREQTFASLNAVAQGSMHATVAAADALKAIVPPQKSFPTWKIIEPPAPETLLSYFRAAQDQLGVPWEYLAAIQLVETRMGRIRGTSTAGAQGPMQFIPATWARYGHGDINSFPGSIMAAARLLVANGAPERMQDALYHYNPSPGYVSAIEHYAQRMHEDERAYYGYYYWQVLYKHVGGSVILPTGYPAVAPEAIE